MTAGALACMTLALGGACSGDDAVGATQTSGGSDGAIASGAAPADAASPGSAASTGTADAGGDAVDAASATSAGSDAPARDAGAARADAGDPTVDAGSVGEGGWAGAWVSGVGQYLCIGVDGQVWLGDSIADLAGPSVCAIAGDPPALTCSGAESGSSFTATITEQASGELLLSVVDCPSGAEGCEGLYMRDPDGPCDEVAAHRGVLGGRCDVDGDCMDGNVCRTFHELGVCTRSCSVAGDCPDATHCLEVGGAAPACVRECVRDGACVYEGSECAVRGRGGPDWVGGPDALCL